MLNRLFTNRAEFRRGLPRRPRDRAGIIGLVLLITGLAGVVSLGNRALRLFDEEVRGLAVAIDGDSLRLAGRELRLAGLDAPEYGQECRRADGKPYPCGHVARAALAERLGQGDLICRIAGPDRYGRGLARCTAGGADLNAGLVRDGIAVAYGDYDGEEAAARAAARGLWAGSFERPQDWRRRHPRN